MFIQMSRRFTSAGAASTALGIADSVRHLHARGILHGDLYAHNVLWHPNGKGLLGDFGAASAYDVSAPQAGALQRIEVRAFGILLGELLERCDDPGSKASMQPLVDECPGARGRLFGPHPSRSGASRLAQLGMTSGSSRLVVSAF